MEEKSEEYVVKGDGPCLLRTTAAHIFGDENEGVNMARNLNKHQSNNRKYYMDKIGADFPLTVKLGSGGNTRIFQDGEEFFNWLESSEEAAYMWRGCVDLMAVSNMANMNIDIVVHEAGRTPELVSFKPDPEFPWMENDPMKPGNLVRDKMTVLNWKDLHYNLIVGPSHMLSQHGSFGFHINESNSKKSSENKVKIIDGGQSERYENHNECKAKLSEKEAEVSSLKKQVKTLQQRLNVEVKEKIQLRKEVNDNKDIEELDSEAAFVKKSGYCRTNPQEPSSEIIKCRKCSIVIKSTKELDVHIESHEIASLKFPCYKCNKIFINRNETVNVVLLNVGGGMLIK